MSRFIVCVVAVACICAVAVQANPAYNVAPAKSYHAAPAVVHLPNAAEAGATALTDAAGAAAAASKISAAHWNALNAYGHQIGVPLLVKNYGIVNPLYAASLPPRSFVGQIDPAFLKDHYGNVRFLTGSSIGVVAI